MNWIYEFPERSNKKKVELKVVDYKVNVYGFSMIIDWSTNIETDSKVIYAFIDEDEKQPQKQDSKTLSDSEQTLNHRIKLDNLRPSATYLINLSGTTLKGESFSEEIGIYKTAKDVIPPVISNIDVHQTIDSKNNKVEAIISWETNEVANSKVSYWEENKDNTKSDQPTQLVDDELVYIHSMVLKNIEPSRTYNFKVVSEDVPGQLSRSKTNTFFTIESTNKQNKD